MNCFGSTTPELTERERRNAALARRAAAEGMVLLQNDGTLPLSPQPVALFGMGARKTVSGGEGSGDVAPRYKITIEQGLEDAGYTITSKAWLDDYDAEYRETYEEYRMMVEEKIAHIPNPVAQIPAAHSYKYRCPSGRRITEQDVVGVDTALYVLMRQAGECNDRRNEPGDFQLTDIEKDNLRFLAAHCRHVVLIVNVGGLVDLSILDEVPISAVIFYVQGGMEGGHALADLLCGKVNFSGKLADSWPMRYEDIPFGESFSSLNGELDHEDYREGLYIGYRYFDSFGVAPRWPFGYGLSYTQFALQTTAVCAESANLRVTVQVTNTGAVAGREVVQMYLSVPGGVAQSLCAYAKTSVIAAGAAQEMTLQFDLRDQSVWDDATAAYILPAGEYRLQIGTSSRATEPVAAFMLEQLVTVRQCRSCCAPQTPLDELQAPPRTLPPLPQTAVQLTLDPAALAGASANYEPQPAPESDWVRQTLDRLTPEQQIELVRGGDLQNQAGTQHQIMGAAGKTCITLLDEGVPNVLFSDGPAGVNIMEEVVYGPDGSQKTAKMPEKYNWGLMKRMASRFIGLEGQHVYRYATAWPVEELLAQTWDPALLEEIGAATGEELQEFGITLWLAPGMNLHRNPLCGRTFEYYSEDPHLTGTLAAALTRGVQCKPGIGVTLKHFCCNNQEDNRFAVSSNVSERTLRQLYLRSFELAVRDGAPKAIMTSYNKLNGRYTGEREDLIAGILRGEWQYDGLVMTDWGTRYDALTALRATTDLMMPGSDTDKQALLNALQAGTLDLDALRRSAARVLHIVEHGIQGEKTV